LVGKGYGGPIVILSKTEESFGECSGGMSSVPNVGLSNGLVDDWLYVNCGQFQGSSWEGCINKCSTITDVWAFAAWVIVGFLAGFRHDRFRDNGIVDSIGRVRGGKQR